jgi:hypothetical protein
MEKNRDILEREDLKRRPFTVPEGYFNQLQERLGAIPRESAPDAGMQRPSEGTERRWIRPAMVWATGVAALLAVGVWVFNGSGGKADPSAVEIVTYEQMASSDLIPRTDPYIYYPDETEQAVDTEQEEMIAYLLQSPIF